MQDRALTTSWLAAKLGTQSGRIEAMRRGGQLYAIRRPGEQDYLYPSWQFDESGRREFLLGNVPNRVSHNARCTVVIVNTVGAVEGGRRR